MPIRRLRLQCSLAKLVGSLIRLYTAADRSIDDQKKERKPESEKETGRLLENANSVVVGSSILRCPSPPATSILCSAHLIGQGLNQNIIVPINLPSTLLDMQINGALNVCA